VFSKLPAELIRNPGHRLPLSSSARVPRIPPAPPALGQHSRVPPQRRGRPPRRESRARRGPADRSASPSPPSRKSRRRPKNQKTPQILSPNFP
jgi:hypothetical protein